MRGRREVDKSQSVAAWTQMRGPLIFCVLALGWLLVLGNQVAMAAFSHSVVEKTFNVAGTNCSDIAVHEATESIYAVCGPNNGRAIEKYDYEGDPVNFTSGADHVEGNRIIADPGRSIGDQVGPRIAVHNSPGPNNGLIFLATNEITHASIFTPNGEFIGVVETPLGYLGGLIIDYLFDVDVSPTGTVYVAGNLPGNRISRYDDLFIERERLYQTASEYSGASDVTRLAADSTGAVWLHVDPAGFGPNEIVKFENDQFTTSIKANFESPPSVIESFLASPSPFAPFPLLTGTPGNFDVDPVTDDLYVPIGGQIRTYSPGTASMPSYEKAPRFGSGGTSLTVLGDHRVISLNGSQVTRYGTGEILPDINTHVAEIDNVGHTEVELTGEVDLAGGPAVTDCKLQIGKTLEYSEPEVPCTPPAFGSNQEVSATATGLETGEEYHYRFKATTAEGTNFGIDRTVTPAFVLKVKTNSATEVDPNGATLNGSMDPDGMATTYYFEYGADTGYGQTTNVEDAGEAFGETVVEAEVDGLPEGRVWHYRLVASNTNGTTHGPDRTFRTASVPDISGVRTSEVRADSAVLHARIDPVGFDTEYLFEYGTTPEYGLTAPLSPLNIGSGNPVDVSQKIEGLQQGFTYHFRVVATNKWGSSASSNTTFDFSPPGCPNDHVRQHTRASYLPDCRAYELVSPAKPGGVVFWPTDETIESWISGEMGRWPLYSGNAVSPSRFPYFGSYGTVEGTDSPNFFLDLYLATRTTEGWKTTTPVLQGKEAALTGFRQCSESFSICIDHKMGGAEEEPSENAPYMFNAEGEFLGRLPTNVGVIPGGTTFNGEQKLSGDGSTFVFASSNVAFAPTGVTGGIGSAYSNDIGDLTVEIISRLPGGGDIPSTGGKFSFPAMSKDGSSTLMQVPASGGGSRLYMRVGEAFTADITQGAGVQLIGAARDGSKVIFVADQQLTVDDTDSSADLYMWRKETETLERLSPTNSDECSPSSGWTSGCSIEALETDRGHPHGLQSIPGLDDPIAEEAGDVYFLSPESLDPSKPGVLNAPNLYVYRQGQVQLVATLDVGTKVNRIQISPDGSHAAFLTAARLTGYDNNKFRQMYTYDADAREIRCASCNPTGLRPGAHVRASQAGPFMSDDGRAFFATSDSLVPRDANGDIIDVYEYVGGRPQLITSGQASRDFTGESGIFDLVSTPVFTGLEAVSSDGTDVFFSTYDTLIPEDQNGEFVKFYTARTNGGFPPQAQLAPCAAADECHGPDSSRPPAPAIATGTQLGSGGTVRPATRKSKRRKANRRRAAKRRRAQRRRRSAQRRRSARGRAARAVRRSHG
jgi:hypothetical protein